MGKTASTVIVNDYLCRKMLGDFGYSFDPNELSQFDALCFIECHIQFSKLENDRRETQMRQARSRRR